MTNNENSLALKIKYTSWGLCGIADVLDRNMLSKDLDDYGPPLPRVVEAHLITAFKIMAHQLNEDTENLEMYQFKKRDN